MEEGTTEFYMPYDKVPGEPPRRSDQDIRRDIDAALFYDRAIQSYRVTVDVQNGQVTLCGTVDSEAEKQKAERDARVIPGVRLICNDLSVQPAA